MPEEKMIHQYIERNTSEVRNEKIFGDRIVNFIYSNARENVEVLYNAAISARMSALLGHLNFTLPFGNVLTGSKRMIQTLGVDLAECLDSGNELNTARKIFERKIKYWECRPMTQDSGVVVSPADAKILIGSFSETSQLFLKDKFFSFEEMFVGHEKHSGRPKWIHKFKDGDFAVLRLTPEKYHYNHTPVSGEVLDIYEIPGVYHSCNPTAVIEVGSPFSKNKRVVTIIDTDVAGGSYVGLVAMIEVVALMIGDIVQCYSDCEYNDPQEIRPGMFLEKGRPKSLYRPGSSTDVLIFQKDKIRFCNDIVKNMYRMDAKSRFSQGFGRPLVETSVAVRSAIAYRRMEQ
jgi:phosphatidylserine decarboxylase